MNRQEAGRIVGLSNRGKVPCNKGKHHCQEAKDKTGNASKERWADPKYREKMTAIKRADTYRNNISTKAKDRWNTPEWAEMMMSKLLEANKASHPNRPESKIMHVLKSISPDFKYTGDGSLWISGMNPDFIDEEKKQIIEVFGCYWHGCPKHFPDKKKQRYNAYRINKFKKLGYSILIIWEHELNDLQTVILGVERWMN